MDVRTSALLVVDLEFAVRNGVLEQARRLVDAARVEADAVCRDGADFGSKASLATPLEGRAGSAGAAVLINSRKVTHSGTRALSRGEVVLATDATATISDEWQKAAFSYALTRIAELRTVDELVAELSS